MSNTNNHTAVIITGSGKIAATINGVSYTIDTDHPKYKEALESVRQKDWNGFIDLVNISKQVQSYFDGTNVVIKDGAIQYQGQVVHNTLTKRIINFMRDDLPYQPLIKFFENLMENPSKRAVDELYDFLEAGELPITEDGHFLAFKNVRANYFDIHSGTMRNMIGDKPSMPRNMVDEDKERTCSQGLHFCSIKYLPNFSDSDGGHTMILKINPKDVVAIPADYQNTKGRACTYEVVSEYKDDWRSKIQKEESGFDSELYSSDGGEYEFDNEEEYYSSNPQMEEDEGCTYSNGCDDNHCFCGDNDDKYGVKPNGHKYHNVRDNTGKFTKKVW